MIRHTLRAAFVFGALASCDAKPRVTAARAEASTPVALAPATATASAERPPNAECAIVQLPPGAAAEACSIVKGPIQLAFTGPVTFWADAGTSVDRDPDILINLDGAPRLITLPPSAKKPIAGSKRPERQALAEVPERATSPGCAAIDSALFCADKAGSIHRTSHLGEGSRVVAKARPGAPIAAAGIAGGHSVLAFLGDRKTSEGVVTLAFAAFDDATPSLLSEDGSGATFVTLAPRGDEVVAMYIDARRALTPVHARVLSVTSNKLVLGPDAVLFVGEATEGRSPGALALGANASAFALIPISKDITGFGMAAIRVDEQPRDDAQVTWSLYPSGLDRAPIAASRGVAPARVARVRPASGDPRARALLELGELGADGAFTALCAVAESAFFTDLSLFADRFGTVWIAYTDASGTWVEQRGRAP